MCVTIILCSIPMIIIGYISLMIFYFIDTVIQTPPGILTPENPLLGQLEEAQDVINFLRSKITFLQDEVQTYQWKANCYLLVIILTALTLLRMWISSRASDKKILALNEEVAVLKCLKVGLKRECDRLVVEKIHLQEELETLHQFIQSRNSGHSKTIFMLNAQIANQKETIENLTKQVGEIKQRLAQEVKKGTATLSKQALTKQKTQLQKQENQLDKELVELKKSKFFLVRAGLEEVNKRAELLSTQTFKNSKANKREDFSRRFQELKAGNDLIIKDLTTVTFKTRFHERGFNQLVRMQEENDQFCTNTTKKIDHLARKCKHLLEKYTSAYPDRLLKAIADHTKDIDRLGKIDFGPGFSREVEIQEEVIQSLLKEREVLENILKIEETNRSSATQREKPNNLDFINNLDRTNALVVRNMAEGRDELDDIIKFEEFARQAVGRKVFINGVERYGPKRMRPIPVRVTFKSNSDLEDLLNSKTFLPDYCQ